VCLIRTKSQKFSGVPGSARSYSVQGNDDFSKFFFGDTTDDLSTYRDRLLLRLHEYPPFSQKLMQVARQGNDTLELIFSAMPEEAVNGLRELIGPRDTKIEFFAFTDERKNPLLGVRITPSNLDTKSDD